MTKFTKYDRISQIVNRTVGTHGHVRKSVGTTNVHDSWGGDLVLCLVKFVPLRGDKVKLIRFPASYDFYAHMIFSYDFTLT